MILCRPFQNLVQLITFCVIMLLMTSYATTNKVRVAKDHGKTFPSKLGASFSGIVYWCPGFDLFVRSRREDLVMNVDCQNLPFIFRSFKQMAILFG